MEIDQFEGDLFWNYEDTESTCDDPDDELDNVGQGQVVRFEQAKRLFDFYGVIDKDDKPRYFTTLAEAQEVA